MFLSQTDQYEGTVYVSQTNIEYKNQATNKMDIEESNGLELTATELCLPSACGPSQQWTIQGLIMGIMFILWFNCILQSQYCACIVTSVHCCIALLNQNPT